MDIQINPRILRGRVEAVSSKSDVHRLMIAAAFSDKKTEISFNGISGDIEATINVLKSLGAGIDIKRTGNECYVTVCPCSYGNAEDGVVLDCDECGTTARLIMPVAAAVKNSFTITGAPGLRKRPFAPLCEAMAENGAMSDGTELPINVSGRLVGGRYRIAGNVSSQYISGLLMAAPLTGEELVIELTTPLQSSAYVDITLSSMKKFGVNAEKTDTGFCVPGGQSYISPGRICAEGDWSNSAVWLAAGAIGKEITVGGLDIHSVQGDRGIIDILRLCGARVECADDGQMMTARNKLLGYSADASGTPDLVPVLACVASLCEGETVLKNLSRLRIKESDRLETVASTLILLGADIKIEGDSLVIKGKPELCGAKVDGCNDHRIVMLAALAAQCCREPVIITGAEAVNKSYPTFFDDYKSLGGDINVL